MASGGGGAVLALTNDTSCKGILNLVYLGDYQVTRQRDRTGTKECKQKDKYLRP